MHPTDDNGIDIKCEYDIIYKYQKHIDLGVDESWWALWSSKPAWGVNSFLGEFDSHISPPK